MENNAQKQQEKEQSKKDVIVCKESEPKPLFEDLKGHKHDDASYQKLMQEQANRRKNETK